MSLSFSFNLFFFFNDTATTEIYTLSLHDALPILVTGLPLLPGKLGEYLRQEPFQRYLLWTNQPATGEKGVALRSEEHTSELQSQSNLVCRLLLEKKKKKKKIKKDTKK